MEKNLKKILYGLMLILIGTMSLTSCKDDDKSKEGNHPSELVGTWVDSEDPDYYLVFQSNGKGYDVYDGDYDYFNWDAKENILSIRFEYGETWDGIYRVSSDGRILNFDGDTYIKR